MRNWLIAVCSIVVALGAGTALADLTYTQGAGTTIFDFICFSTKHCPAHVLIDSSGTEKGTTANPVMMSLATGSLAVGSGVDGWNQTDGTKADPAWITGSGSIVALLKATSAAEIADACNSGVKANLPISSAVTATLAVAGSGSKKVYACSLILTTTGAMAISFVEGTGSQCATTQQAAVIGGLTPSSGGLALATPTNLNLLMGNGKGSIAFTATAGNGLCIYQSTTGSILAGNLTYVQQ